MLRPNSPGSESNSSSKGEHIGSSSTWTKDIRSTKRNEDMRRPPVLTGLLDKLRKKDEPSGPSLFLEFERAIEVNDVQFARFEFLRMHCSYDGALVGPVEFNPPKRGANAIDIIFKYYASRRQLEDKNTVVAQTFEEAAAHNLTIDAPELAKFVKDFFPSVFSHKEVNWMFVQANKFNGVSDGDTFTMDMSEFTGLLCQMGCQLYKGGTPAEIAAKMGKRMGLHDPKAIIARLDLQGRTDAGFGAWKAEKPFIVQPLDSSMRCVLDANAIDNILPDKQMHELIQNMTYNFPVMQLVEWIPFEGQYISMAIPRGGVRKGKKARFQIVIGNMAPRAFLLLTRIQNLPFVSMKYSPPRPIAPGMEMVIEMVLDDLPLGEHHGAVVFSVDEGGEELFRCPIYIRVSKENVETLADHTCNIIARHVPKQKILEAFRASDEKGYGRLPLHKIVSCLEGLNLHISGERMQALISHKVDYDPNGFCEYRELVDMIHAGLPLLSEMQRERLHLGTLAVKLPPLERQLAIYKIAVPLPPSLAGLVNVNPTPSGTPTQSRTQSGAESPASRRGVASRSTSRLSGTLSTESFRRGV